MFRIALVSVVSANAVVLPVSTARADTMNDLARSSYRLGVAALDAVDATPAQRRAVSDAARDLGARLAPHEADVRQWATSAHRAFVADTVDRASVEAVRVEGVKLVEVLSEESVDFVVDVAETLTVEQRRALARLVERRADQLLHGG